MLTDPAIARHRLGVKLRELREARSLRLEDVAASLGVVPSTLSRIETGKAPTRHAYLAAMLATYGVDDPGLQQLLADWARDGDCAGWWAGYADLLPDGAGRYLGLEAAASLVRAYSVQVVPDLLQTRDYAAAVCRAAQPGLSADQVRALVTVIMRRQEIARANLSCVHMVIDEGVLLRRIAPADVMAAQLDHLRASAVRPAVTLQIIALAAPASVLSPPVTVLSLADPAGTDMKVSYGPGGQIIISTRAADIRHAVATFTALAQAALPPGDSVSLVGEVARSTADRSMRLVALRGCMPFVLDEVACA